MPETIPLNFPAGKLEFDFNEAANLLGLSAAQLQALVAERLTNGEGLNELSRMRFRPADLIMLNWVHTAPASLDAE